MATSEGRRSAEPPTMSAWESRALSYARRSSNHSHDPLLSRGRRRRAVRRAVRAALSRRGRDDRDRGAPGREWCRRQFVTRRPLERRDECVQKCPRWARKSRDPGGREDLTERPDRSADMVADIRLVQPAPVVAHEVPHPGASGPVANCRKASERWRTGVHWRSVVQPVSSVRRLRDGRRRRRNSPFPSWGSRPWRVERSRRHRPVSGGGPS